MILLDQISEDDFPVVDFKFQNRGQATACLYQFSINILSVRVDPTPVLSHLVSLAGIARRSTHLLEGNFLLFTQNDGWGDARDCYIRLHEPTLERIFSCDKLIYRGDLSNGRQCATVHLDPGNMNVRRFHDLLRAHNASHEQDAIKNWITNQNHLRLVSMGRSAHEQIDATLTDCIPLEFPSVVSEYHDINGKYHKLDRTSPKILGTPGAYGRLFLRTTGFVWITGYNSLLCSSFSPTSRYFVSIDPDTSQKCKTYSISHSVASGDLERFQIVLGAPKSCVVTLRFSFYTDSTPRIDSDVFEVHIWAPRNSGNCRGSHLYRDGDELLSRAIERAAKLYVPHDSCDGEPLNQHTEDCFNSSFPFLKE